VPDPLERTTAPTPRVHNLAHRRIQMINVDSMFPALDPLERVEWEGEAEMRRLEAERELLETIRRSG
jgi:hypothetical protein